MRITIVERGNPLAVHGIFDSKESAELHLKNVIPEHVKRGFFMDKTLKAQDFVVKVQS